MPISRVNPATSSHSFLLVGIGSILQSKIVDSIRAGYLVALGLGLNQSRVYPSLDVEASLNQVDNVCQVRRLSGRQGPQYKAVSYIRLARCRLIRMGNASRRGLRRIGRCPGCPQLVGRNRYNCPT